MLHDALERNKLGIGPHARHAKLVPQMRKLAYEMTEEQFLEVDDAVRKLFP
jgi:hypothetical protein